MKHRKCLSQKQDIASLLYKIAVYIYSLLSFIGDFFLDASTVSMLL